MTAEQDRQQMLSHAARACGKSVTFKVGVCKGGPYNGCFEMDEPWRPDQDDADCARLEASLSIDIGWDTGAVNAIPAGRPGVMSMVHYADHGGDKQAARRVATFTLAARIGAAMEDQHVV